MLGDKRMKKKLLLCIMLIISLLLCGCDDQPAVEDDAKKYGGMYAVIELADTESGARRLESVKDTEYATDFELEVNKLYVLRLGDATSFLERDYFERLIELIYDETLFEITPFYGDEYERERPAEYYLTVKCEVKMATIIAESEYYKDRGIIVISAK